MSEKDKFGLNFEVQRILLEEEKNRFALFEAANNRVAQILLEDKLSLLAPKDLGSEAERMLAATTSSLASSSIKETYFDKLQALIASVGLVYAKDLSKFAAGQERAFALQSSAKDEFTRLNSIVGTMSSSAWEVLQNQRDLVNDWARRHAEPTEAYLASSQFLKSLVTTEALLQTQALREDFFVSAFQPQIAYQNFARQQLDLIATTASDAMRRNRLTIIDSAAELLEDMNSGFELGMLMNPTLPATHYEPLPPVNVYTELAVELEEYDLEEDDIDVEVVVLESGPGQVTQIGSRLVRQIYDLNLLAERSGTLPIFKPTNKMLYGCSVVPTRIATDEQSFAEIIDQLYFLLYEGSGAAKRLTEKCPPDSLEALWKVKDLRTGARHDVDHGSSKDVDKKNRQIGEAYKSLIGTVVPRKRSEWLQAQIALYEQLSAMLEMVEAAVLEVKPSGPTGRENGAQG
jgi:hypothetical protein